MPAVGDVFAMPFPRGWGACQVIRSTKTIVEVVALHFRSERLPTLADVPLRALDRHEQPHDWENWHRANGRGALPPSFVHLGKAKPLHFDEKYAGDEEEWERFVESTRTLLRWFALPEAVRKAAGEAESAAADVKVKLSPGESEFTTDNSWINLEIGSSDNPDATHITTPAKFKFKAFDVLPAVRSLDVKGYAPDLVTWLATRPMIGKISWAGPLPALLDLSATALHTCRLEVHGPLELRLPVDFSDLTLVLPDKQAFPITVHAHDDGAAIALGLVTVWGAGIAEIKGLGRAYKVVVSSSEDLDLHPLCEAFKPRMLSFYSNWGVVRGSDALARLTALEALKFENCVNLDAEHMPPPSQWPDLRKASIEGAAESQIAILEAAWKGDKRLTVTESKSDFWVKHNCGRAFGRWTDTDHAGEVDEAFVKASTKLDSKGIDEPKAGALLKKLLDTLNKCVKETTPFTADEVADVEAEWAKLVEPLAPNVAAKVAAAWLAKGRKGW